MCSLIPLQQLQLIFYIEIVLVSVNLHSVETLGLYHSFMTPYEDNCIDKNLSFTKVWSKA